MLYVKTYLDKSKIQGIGLFAGENIKKGTVIWRFKPKFDIVIKKKERDKLPKLTREWMTRYAYHDVKMNGYIICADDARFFNHSPNPNTIDRHNVTMARRNIRKGEELTSNYYDFDDETTEDDFKQ